MKHFMRILRHKYYVFKAGRVLGVPLYLLIWHDMSKFLPQEYFAYERKFNNKSQDKKEFSHALNRHLNNNKHHWQYWRGNPMPDRYIREMVADWLGASKAYDGNWPKSLATWKVALDVLDKDIHPASKAISRIYLERWFNHASKSE